MHEKGKRAEVLFDSIDLQILKILNSAQLGIGVLDLVQRLNLKHKNLKPHLDKLIALGLVIVWRDTQNQKIKICSEMEVFGDNNEDEELQDKIKKHRALLEFLEKAEEENNKLKSMQLTLFDLRKKKVIQNIGKKIYVLLSAPPGAGVLESRTHLKTLNPITLYGED